MYVNEALNQTLWHCILCVSVCVCGGCLFAVCLVCFLFLFRASLVISSELVGHVLILKY